MEWSVLKNGCVDGSGGNAWTNRFILNIFFMERTEVVEKLKIRSGMRDLSTKFLLQIYGLKVRLVNITM